LIEDVAVLGAPFGAAPWVVVLLGWPADVVEDLTATLGAAGLAVLDFVCASAGVANVNSAPTSPMVLILTLFANDRVPTNHRSLLHAVLPGVPFTTYCTSLTLSSTKITFMFL
jgi:hypothetical protein